jgi:hypothetical protein
MCLIGRVFEVFCIVLTVVLMLLMFWMMDWILEGAFEFYLSFSWLCKTCASESFLMMRTEEGS